ncbi:MAG: amidohydrolase family protein [Acidobacteria bacterium]|nr:amidohydrolase family protein [Acidobacteriota bacterium]
MFFTVSGPATAQEPPVDEHEKEVAPIPDSVADKKEDESEEKWDVSSPPGPKYTATLDVREGTWLSLDVSPDGREIVFDLMGDLYVIPISGGEARNLTSGIEWDMQPQYSPDGNWIAFTSDRSGGDNIWIMRRDGSDPKQVTKETFRLLNSPVWSHDGQYIAARKHFTSRRSLGAGEIWLYHRSGGEGLQMTEKPNEQKDLGEPAFSPDGRYLYYSQDTTPGDVFEYSKNVHEGIYSIKRLDRETGETDTILSGPGGAIRPTPSHDGEWLAFIRRRGLDTVLHVVNLKSGEIRPLFSGLDRDMQETWAIHGVYPSMAWTPDDRSIVVWGQGRFHRVDVASGEATLIPFHVKDERTMTEVVRFPIEVAPDSFEPKMLRWVEVSPNGKQVLYQTLGYIWIKDLPNGTPRRLTSQTERFEYYPSWSRDGNWIVYTTWDDSDLGDVRMIRPNGRDVRVLTQAPGHYVEPALSPDNRSVVYRKMSGGYLTSPLYSFDTGLWIAPVVGGEAEELTSSGFEPQFGAEQDRVYFTRYGEEFSRELKSIRLNGSDERTHYKSDNATELSISPDGKWLAFTEQFNAWITPFVSTGTAISIGPDASAVPTSRVTDVAGEYIHWSGDSSRLHWSLGPELFTRELRESFAFMEGAPAELPEPPSAGVNISFRQKFAAPSGVIALTGARLITMNGDEVIDDGTIVVEGNRITAVGPSSGVAIPRGAQTVDLSGRTIMPGIIDAHWHGPTANDEIVPEQNWYFFNSLAFGVTTIHDPSNDTSEIFAASEMGKAGIIVAPRIYSTGTILYGAKAPFKAIIESYDDALAHLKRLKAVGAFSVKSYNQPRRDQRQQVIEAARELEMMVVPEGGSLFEHNMNMVVDGHTGIEHSIPVANIYDDTIQLWSQSETAYTPTLVVGYGGIWGEHYWYDVTNVWENERLRSFAPSRFIDARSRRRMTAAPEDYNHFNNARVAAELADVGVEVQVGAHGQREGLAAHWEFWMFEQGGMSNHQALRAATLWGAQYIGLDGDLGSLEAGKLADLIVLEADPLENIRNSESVSHTMINGRLYEARTMKEIAPREWTPEPFWFSGQE